ncbi:MAG: hypothetical protein GY816_23530 [Cytophagales bacterium]|nr:hypothetical protein [Cytophagales bacterium]
MEYRGKPQPEGNPSPNVPDGAKLNIHPAVQVQAEMIRMGTKEKQQNEDKN